DIRYYEKRNSSLEDHGIRQIIFGINDELWLRYSGYFAKFYPDTDEFSIFELPHEGVDDFKVNYIDVDVDNTVYVATSNGLYIIRPDSPVIEHHAVLNTYTDLSAVKVVGDMIYIARMYGIHEYYKDRINDESLNRYWDNWSASTYATDMELDHENILWIVTNNVVFDLILDEGNLINTIYLAKDIDIDSINRKWFSYGSNIWMIGSDNKYSGHWDLDMWVSGIAVKSNDEIVCSCNGISSFDLEKGQLSNFRDLSNSNKVDPTSGGIWKCNENEIWIGSEYFDKNNKRGREFNILHLNDGTWTLRKLESEKFFKTKDFQIWRQAWDKTDILWLIVDYFRDDFYELWIYDPRDESLLAFRNTPLNTYHYISDIEVDSYNRLWIAADDNILIYDIVNDSWIVYDNNIYSNLNSEVHDIEFDKLNNDIVLIGTENGLVIYNLKENSWFYTVEYGTGIIEILSTKFDIWFETGSDSFWQRYNRSSNIYFDKQYSIRSLLDDADGVVFGRSWSNKIVKYSREENDFIEVYNNQNSVLPNGYITLDYLDNRKMILNSGEFILWR
ncbi:hypothetical protein KKB18_11460, partial [bacterium]|nr:hypothetical protein [bacterium]